MNKGEKGMINKKESYNIGLRTNGVKGMINIDDANKFMLVAQKDEVRRMMIELSNLVSEHHDLVDQCCGLHHLFEEVLEKRLEELKE